MDMQRLGTDMMERYGIEDRRPVRVNAVQFGAGETLLGAVDRLIDDMNATLAPEARMGVACVEADDSRVERLSVQDGMYTLLVRGYAGDAAVRREQVVQCLLRVDRPDALGALAADPGVALAIVDDAPAARALAARFASARREAGLPDLPQVALGAALSGDTDAPGALADSLVFRAEPDEAARQCAEMNYLDDMLHIAEPFARLTLCGVPDALRRRFPLDRVPGARFEDASGARTALRLKAQAFDAGIFLMAAAGWLNGCDTLSDCMRHGRLRQFVGEGFTRELMPALSDVDRQAVEGRVIESFERYENPLNRNRILRAAGGLLSRFSAGAGVALGRLAEQRTEPPRRLSFALAATIMLYAGARPNPKTGLYEVARGSEVQVLNDDPEKLAVFASLSHDMPPESLAYAALADRELWDGLDLRGIDGLLDRVTLDLAAMQRQPDFLPEAE